MQVLHVSSCLPSMHPDQGTSWQLYHASASASFRAAQSCQHWQLRPCRVLQYASACWQHCKVLKFCLLWYRTSLAAKHVMTTSSRQTESMATASPPADRQFTLPAAEMQQLQAMQQRNYELLERQRQKVLAVCLQPSKPCQRHAVLTQVYCYILQQSQLHRLGIRIMMSSLLELLPALRWPAIHSEISALPPAVHAIENDSHPLSHACSSSAMPCRGGLLMMGAMLSHWSPCL